MKNKLVNAETGRELSQTQYQVFRKIMSIYGPKRSSEKAKERWIMAYYKAQKDFEDIFGFKPELKVKTDKKWRKIDNVKDSKRF